MSDETFRYVDASQLSPIVPIDAENKPSNKVRKLLLNMPFDKTVRLADLAKEVAKDLAILYGPAYSEIYRILTTIGMQELGYERIKGHNGHVYAVRNSGRQEPKKKCPHCGQEMALSVEERSDGTYKHRYYCPTSGYPWEPDEE